MSDSCLTIFVGHLARVKNINEMLKCSSPVIVFNSENCDCVAYFASYDVGH